MKKLIVGLGNIGVEYEQTRHNIGFKIVDAFADTENQNFENQKLGNIASFLYRGRKVLLLKPNTYMNLSGKSVRYWMHKEKIPIDNLLIITDDIHLQFGTIRLKSKGSAGGHNGLKSIADYLQTTAYNRFKFGVGSDFGKGKQVDYVLGNWTKSEKEKLEERIPTAIALLRSFVFAGVTNTMQMFNGK